MMAAGGLGSQRRCFSATTVNLKQHARAENKRFTVENMYNRTGTLGKYSRVTQGVMDPLNGKKGLENKYHEDHPWDIYGNHRQRSTFSERGIAYGRLLSPSRRLRSWINVGKHGVTEAKKFGTWTPKWDTFSTNFCPPPHMLLPPGFRPFTEWPTYKAEEYNKWSDYPNVRNQSPILNVPDMQTRYANDRAKKLDVLREKLAASNFRLQIRAKWEQSGGEQYLGPRMYESGGSKGAVPSPHWNFRRSESFNNGEVFGVGAGRGSFPKPNNHRD